jgi:hypothetical protein
MPSILKSTKLKSDYFKDKEYSNEISNCIIGDPVNSSLMSKFSIPPKPQNNYIDTTSKNSANATGLNWYYRCKKYINFINTSVLPINYSDIVLLRANYSKYDVHSHVVVFTNADPSLISKDHLRVPFKHFKNEIVCVPIHTILEKISTAPVINPTILDESKKVSDQITAELTYKCGYKIKTLNLVKPEEDMSKEIAKYLQRMTDPNKKILKDDVVNFMLSEKNVESLGDSFSLPYQWGKIIKELPPIKRRRILQDQKSINELSSFCPDLDLMLISGRARISSVLKRSLLNQMQLIESNPNINRNSNLVCSLYLMKSIIGDMVVSDKKPDKAIEVNLLEMMNEMMTLHCKDVKPVGLTKPKSNYKGAFYY